MIIYQVEPQHVDLIWSSVVPLFCKENDISHIEIMAHREGWERLLSNKGYKKYYTVLVKEMNND